MRERVRVEPPGRPQVWKLRLPGGRTLRAGETPSIVGVLNCTPDSFSDGGLHGSDGEAVQAALEMLSAGADWIDVGGESTRPGAAPVPPEVQVRRVVPVIRGLRAHTDLPISVDTMSPRVARLALEAGADIINDVSASRDPEWRTLLREWDVPVVLVHMRGSPRDMQVEPRYPVGAVPEVLAFFVQRLRTLADWGVDPARSLVDPGIGFGKELKDNLELIRNIDSFRTLGRPIFIGISRKSLLRRILEPKMGPPARGVEMLDLATTVANTVAILGGAHFIRVHNVVYARILVEVLTALSGAGEPAGPPLAAAPEGREESKA